LTFAAEFILLLPLASATGVAEANRHKASFADNGCVSANRPEFPK
jgi:hypothetical protein